MKNKESQNQKKDSERKGDGLCVVCGKPIVNIRGKPIPGLTRCFLHSNKHN